MMDDIVKKLYEANYRVYRSDSTKLLDGSYHLNLIAISPKADANQLKLFDYESNKYWN